MPRWRQRSRRQLSWRLIYVTCPPPFSICVLLGTLAPIGLPGRHSSSPLRLTHALRSPGAYRPLSSHYTPEFDRQCIWGIAGIVPSIKRNFKCLGERFCPQELDGWRAALTAGLLDDT